MNDKPLVSVITVFLNEERFLSEAVNSVLAQTYSSWELLLVDDGSTDGSSNIAKEYAQRYPNQVFYLEHEGHENRSAASSRNLGLAHARGELIAYLDADDVFLPDKLERQVSTISRLGTDVGAVLNPIYVWFEDGRKERQLLNVNLSSGLYPRGAWFAKLLENLDNTAATCGILIRKDIITDVGGSEESFKGFYEDTVLWFKIALRTAIYYDPEYVALVRVHASSNSHSFTYRQQMVHAIHFYEWLTKYLKENYGSVYRESDLFSAGLPLVLTIARDCHQTQQLETIAALSYLLEPLMPKILGNPEWNYFTGVSFQYILTKFEEALRRYDIALQYGFDESGIPMQYGFDEFGARFNRGMIHFQLKHFREAEADFQRALELKPDRQDAKEMLEKVQKFSDLNKQTDLNSPMGLLLSIYSKRSDLQQAFPEVAANHDYRRLLKWAQDTVNGKTGDYNTGVLKKYSDWYNNAAESLEDVINEKSDPFSVLLTLYLIRVDLQSAFPEVIDGDYKNLLKWAKDTVNGKTGDYNEKTLLKFAEWYNKQLDSSDKIQYSAFKNKAISANLELLRDLKLVNHKNFPYISQKSVSGISYKMEVGSPMEQTVVDGIYFEKEILEEMLKNVKDGDVIYDIGSSTGTHTIPLAMRTGKLGIVYSFEPDVECAKVLRYNIQLNNLRNVQVMETALWENDSMVVIHTGGREGPAPQVTEKNQQARCSVEDLTQHYEICGRSIESLVRRGEIRAPNMIKIDVEGAALLVLRGLGQLKPRDIFIEVHSPIGESREDIAKLLNEAGYDLISESTREDEIHLYFQYKPN